MPARDVQRRVCWLVHLSVAKPATRGTRENVPPGIARNSLGRTIVRKLPGLLAATLTDNEGEGDALCRAPHSTRPIPLGDPRFVDLGPSCGPQITRNASEPASEPGRRVKISSRRPPVVA